MTTISRAISHISLAIGLLAAASAASAAIGFTVLRPQESKITTGMTRADMRTVLGRPSHNLKYINEPGRTYTYGVVGDGVEENTVFDVDFSSDGKVLHTSERIEPMSH